MQCEQKCDVNFNTESESVKWSNKKREKSLKRI